MLETRKTTDRLDYQKTDSLGLLTFRGQALMPLQMRRIFQGR
ncbi:hypothetical protein [uncultured Exiguobacterium sp.]|nr:hypothetical protein [uncultured Exiguobacterium sp.]